MGHHSHCRTTIKSSFLGHLRRQIDIMIWLSGNYCLPWSKEGAFIKIELKLQDDLRWVWVMLTHWKISRNKNYSHCSTTQQYMLVVFQDALYHSKPFGSLGIIFSDYYWLTNRYDPLSNVVSKDQRASKHRLKSWLIFLLLSPAAAFNMIWARCTRLWGTLRLRTILWEDIRFDHQMLNWVAWLGGP